MQSKTTMTESFAVVNKTDLTITFQDIKKYICTNATDQEAVMFVQLCKSQGLNPWRREAYLIKYGSQPASMVVGKDLFTRRAQANPKFLGMRAGIIIQRGKDIIEVEGAFKLKTDLLLGGWAEVYLRDYTVPIKSTVSMEEYGKNQSSWTKIPATMIRKVALVQALREAFPDELGGLYDAAEMGVEPTHLTAPEIKPEPTVTADAEVMEPTIIDEFMQVNEDLSELTDPDAYSEFLNSSKGSPTLEQIQAWKSPKQLAWLRSAVAAMKDKVETLKIQNAKSADDLPPFDIEETEASNG